jgi:hypothetical protein
MSPRTRPPARLALASAAAAAAALAIAPLAQARSITYVKLYTYSVKVAVKGGGTFDGAFPRDPGAARAGDVLEEHHQASYSLDARFPDAVFAPTKLRGYPATTGDTRPTTVNGTWSTQGTKWVDPDHDVTAPFTCSGRLKTGTPSPATVLEYRRQTTSFRFTLEVLADELLRDGDCADVNGVRGNMLYANSRAYEVRFTIPKSRFGTKTITKTISGPDAAQPWRQYTCDSTCTFSTAWQGVVRLTRKRVLRVPVIR